MGATKVLAQSPFDSPRQPEPRRQMNPRVAARDKWRRIERLRSLGDWLKDYKDALGRWVEGVRDVLFPAGTYWMRVHHGVECSAPP